MVEGFKLTAKKLKRYLKISTHLPKDYYETNKEYPILLVFDGDLFFSFLTEDDKKINLAKKLEKLIVNLSQLAYSHLKSLNGGYLN